MRYAQITARVGVPARRLMRGLRLRDSADLLLLVLALPLVMLLPVPALRVPLGLALVLFAPGYALTAALFPRRDHVDGVTRAALSLGLSAAALPLLALLLDLLSLPISAGPMALSLWLWLALFCTIAVWRRSAVEPANSVASPTTAMQAYLRRDKKGRSQLGVAAGLVLAVALLAGGTSLLLLADRTARGTEFYVLGRGGMAEDYPRAVAPGEDVQVTMGIANRDSVGHVYRLEICVTDGQAPQRRVLVGEEKAIELAPGQVLEQAITWRMPWTGDDQQVELLLFGEDSAQPHRQLRLWLDMVEPQAP